MSRVEAAAQAIAEQDRRRTNTFHQAQARDALAAADAHDAANGLYRVSLDEATVERAVKALREEFSVDDAVGEYYATAVWGTPEDIARAVLAAAVKEGQ